MAVHVKLVIATQVFSDLPRDRHIITPHFRAAGPYDGDSLCEDAHDVFRSIWCTRDNPRITVTSYDDEGTQPVYPNGSYTTPAPGAPLTVNTNPETAVCLSFHGDHNAPRERGRLYLPVVMNSTASGARPSSTQMTSALDLATAFGALGGPDIDWGVWSPTTNSFHAVKVAWVDDEWDVQRRRGLKATSRQTRSITA